MRLNTVLTEAQILNKKNANKREKIISDFMEGYVKMKTMPLSESGYQLTEKKIRDEFIQQVVLLPMDQFQVLFEEISKIDKFIAGAGSKLKSVKTSISNGLLAAFPTFAAYGKKAMKAIMSAISFVIGKVSDSAAKFFKIFKEKISESCPGINSIKPTSVTKDGVTEVQLMYGDQILIEYKLEDSIGRPALATFVKGDRFAKALDVPSKLAEAIVAIKVALSKDDKTKNEFVRGLNVREIMIELYATKAINDSRSVEEVTEYANSPMFAEWVNTEVRAKVKDISTELGLKDDGMMEDTGCGGSYTIADMDKLMGTPDMTDLVSKFNLPITDVSSPIIQALKAQKLSIAIGVIAIGAKFLLGGIGGPAVIIMLAVGTVIPLMLNFAAAKGRASIPPMKESKIRRYESLAKAGKMIMMGVNIAAFAEAMVTGDISASSDVVNTSSVSTPLDPTAPSDPTKLKALLANINDWEDSAGKEVFSDKTVTAFFDKNPDMTTEQMEQLRTIFDDAHKTNAGYEKMNQIFRDPDKGLDLIDKDIASFQAAADANLASQKADANLASQKADANLASQKAEATFQGASDANLASQKAEAIAKAKKLAAKALLDAQENAPKIIDGALITTEGEVLVADLTPVISEADILASKESIYTAMETDSDFEELVMDTNSEDAASVVKVLSEQAFTPEQAKSFLTILKDSNGFFGDSTYEKLTEGDGKLFASVAEYAKVSEMNADNLKQLLKHVDNGGLEILQPALDANVDPLVIQEIYADVEVEVTDPETDVVTTEKNTSNIKNLFGDNPAEIAKSMQFFAHVEPEQLAKILELSTDNEGVIADITGTPFVGNKGAEALATMLNSDLVTSENIQALADSKALANTYSITSHVGTALDGKTDEILAKFAEIDTAKAALITRDILSAEVNNMHSVMILEADVETLNTYTSADKMIVELNNQSITKEVLDSMIMDKDTEINLKQSIGEKDLVAVKAQLEATKATMAGLIGHSEVANVDYAKVVNVLIEDAKAVNGSLTFDTTAYQTAQDAFIEKIEANGGNLPFAYMTDESIEATITDATTQAQERVVASANNTTAFNVVHVSGTTPDYGSYQDILSTPLSEAQESLSASTRALEMHEGNGDAAGVATATTEIAQSKMDIVVAIETKKVLAAVIQAQDIPYTGTAIEIAAQKSAGISSALQTAMAGVEGGEDVTAKVVAQMEQMQTNATANVTANPVTTADTTTPTADTTTPTAEAPTVSTTDYNDYLGENPAFATALEKIDGGQQDIIRVLALNNVPTEDASALLTAFVDNSGTDSLETFKETMTTATTAEVPMDKVAPLLRSIGANLETIAAGGSLDEVMEFAATNESYTTDITRMMEFAGDGKLERLLTPMSEIEMPKEKIMAVLSGNPENFIDNLAGSGADSEAITKAITVLNDGTVENITKVISLSETNPGLINTVSNEVIFQDTSGKTKMYALLQTEGVTPDNITSMVEHNSFSKTQVVLDKVAGMERHTTTLLSKFNLIESGPSDAILAAIHADPQISKEDLIKVLSVSSDKINTLTDIDSINDMVVSIDEAKEMTEQVGTMNLDSTAKNVISEFIDNPDNMAEATTQIEATKVAVADKLGDIEKVKQLDMTRMVSRITDIAKEQDGLFTTKFSALEQAQQIFIDELGDTVPLELMNDDALKTLTGPIGEVSQAANGALTTAISAEIANPTMSTMGTAQDSIVSKATTAVEANTKAVEILQLQVNNLGSSAPEGMTAALEGAQTNLASATEAARVATETSTQLDNIIIDNDDGTEMTDPEIAENIQTAMNKDGLDPKVKSNLEAVYNNYYDPSSEGA